MPRKRAIPKIVEAEQFVLRDAQGRARATLAMTNESPSFTLRDEQGIPRISVQLGVAGRSLINIENQNGASVGISVDDNGDLGLGMSRQGGTLMLELGCRRNEEVRGIFYNKEGTPKEFIF